MILILMPALIISFVLALMKPVIVRDTNTLLLLLIMILETLSGLPKVMEKLYLSNSLNS